MPGDDNSCSQWVENNGREDVIPDVGEGRSAGSRNLTEKGLAYQKETLRERRRKINGRLIRKYSTIEDLLFSSKNVIAVEEDLKQFNDLFKMLLDEHQEYNQQSGDNERDRDDDWFDDVGTQVCSFKRKVYCWLREAAQKAKSSQCSPKSTRSASDKGSVNSKKSKGSHGSRSSNAFKETTSSKSSKEREIEDKVKVADLMAEAKLLQQKQIIQNEAGKLKIKERLAKAKSRVQAYNNIKIEQHGNEREQLPNKTLDDSCWMKQVRKDDAIRDGMVELSKK